MSARPLLAIATLLSVMFGIGPLHLTASHAADEPQMSLTDVRDQGVHYFKRKRFKQAKRFLDRAFKMSGGPGDFLTVYYRGKLAYNQLLIERAMKMAETAAKLSMGNARRKRSVKGFVAEINGRFGRVNIKPARGETNKRGRIFFDSKTGILNKAKRQRFESIRERFRTTDISLPIQVFLPYGKYAANNVAFEVVEGDEPPNVGIYLQVDRATAEAAGAHKSNTWLYVGFGVGAAVAAGIGGYFLFFTEPPPPIETRGLEFMNLRRGL